MSKIRHYIEVMKHIPDHAYIATTSLGMGGLPEQLLKGLGEYYQKYQSPRDLSVITTGGIGTGPGRGLDHILYPNLLKRATTSYLYYSANTIEAVLNNEIEMYYLPQGIIGQLYRDAARGGVGVFSQVGTETFIDPKYLGGKINEKTRQQEDVVKEIYFNDERWLHYQPLPINVAFIKASYADTRGNLSLKREPFVLEALSIASAVKNNGGIVIAQVEQVVEDYSIPPKEVVVPGALVDYVVVADKKYHMQTVLTQYNPAISNEIRVPLSEYDYLPLSPSKVILRRASQELAKGSFVNVGVGLAANIGQIISESHLIDQIHLSIDLGSIGGMPVPGLDFGMNYNAEAIIPSQSLFEYYHGGGIDTTVLGFGQFNEKGEMNSTYLNGTLNGPGGMLDIVQGADKIVFVGSFTVKAELKIKNQQLVIQKEGCATKFVESLPLSNFSSHYMKSLGKEIILITERAVFEIDNEGQFVLIEIAEGIDLQDDILDLIPWSIKVSEHLKIMDPALFAEDWQLTLE